ncbi:MAG: bile acid:sodium symporter [Chloroflexota bacterium]|nr:bile acid:sodium symporter [Chloroflexota bacterium]
MLVLLLGAAVEGALLPGSAPTLSSFVPLDLAIMIGALGATVPVRELKPTRAEVWPTAVVVVVQLVVLPAFVLVVAPALPPGLVRQGLLVTALAPAEITSGTMVMLAGGDSVMAIRVMVASLVVSVLTIPAGLQLFGGLAVPVQAGAILPELVLIVLVPFLAGSTARQIWPRLAAFQIEFGAVSALAVVLLTFIVAAQIRALGMNQALLFAGVGAAGLNLFGYLIGWLLGRPLRFGAAQRRAAILSCGMREFGVATAVAITFLPAGAAGVPAIYGLIMLVTAATIANALRQSDRAAGEREPLLGEVGA